MGSRLFNIVSLYNYLLSVDYVQSLLQGAESLTSDGCRSQPAEGCSSDRQDSYTKETVPFVYD